MTSPRATRTLPLLLLASLAVLAVLAAAETVVDEDLVIEGAEDWTDDEYTIRANVTVAGGGVLNVTGARLTFAATGELPPHGLAVEPGGTLLVNGSELMAPGGELFMSSAGHLRVVDSTLEDLASDIGGGVTSGVVGGVVASGGVLELEGVTILDSLLHVSCFDCQFRFDGLDMTGGEVGVFATNSTGTLSAVQATDIVDAFVFYQSDVSLSDCTVEGSLESLLALNSELEVLRLVSSSDGIHITLENCESDVSACTLTGGMEGAEAGGGSLAMAGCDLQDMEHGVFVYDANVSIVDTSLLNITETGIELVSLAPEEGHVTLDRVSIRQCLDVGIYLERCDGVIARELEVIQCGDGMRAAGSRVEVRRSVIGSNDPCLPAGCNSEATGSGVQAEAYGQVGSEITLVDCTLDGNAGPGLSSYFSLLSLDNTSVTDGGASGILLVYSDLSLSGSVVAGNAWWGVEGLVYEFVPEELDATWGNGRADVRVNITTNVMVVDQNGDWISHADVTASAGEMVVGPYQTGYGGKTPTFELPVWEYTYGGANDTYNPWAFEAIYGAFNSTQTVELQIGVGQLTLVVVVDRPDLQVTGVEVDSSVESGTDVEVDVTVINDGNASAEGVKVTVFFRDEYGFQRVVGEDTIDLLEVGGSESVTITWRADITGDYTIIAAADVDGLIEETDEDNNQREAAVEVVGEKSPGMGALAALAALATAGPLALSRPGPPGRRASRRGRA